MLLCRYLTSVNQALDLHKLSMKQPDILKMVLITFKILTDWLLRMMPIFCFIFVLHDAFDSSGWNSA